MDSNGIYPTANNTRMLGHPSLRFATVNLGTSINLKETTAPAAPAADCANLWLQDNGAGKSQLMIQFATGAAIDLSRQPTGAIGFIIDGGGSVITTGVKGFVEVPFAGTITSVTLLSTDAAVTAGSIVVDIYKDSYANYPPVVGDSITASAKPTLSSAAKSRDTTLTGWTTAIAAGDLLGFNVVSAATVTRIALSLTVQAG